MFQNKKAKLSKILFFYLGWIPSVGFIIGSLNKIENLESQIVIILVFLIIYFLGLIDYYRLSLIQIEDKILINTLVSSFEFEFNELEGIKILRKRSTYIKIRLFFNSGHKFDVLGDSKTNWMSYFNSITRIIPN